MYDNQTQMQVTDASPWCWRLVTGNWRRFQARLVIRAACRWLCFTGKLWLPI